MMTQQPKYYRDLLDRLLEQDNTDSHQQRLQVLRDKFYYRGPAHFDQEDQLVVPGDFYCRNNQLTSLAGAPVKVGGWFDCSNNQLTSLEGAPVKVGRDFYCYHNPLTSLEGIPRSINGIFSITVNATTPLLKILTVEGITEFYFLKHNTHDRMPELESLFKEFYGRGARGRLLCGIEMLKMGYKRNTGR